MRDVCSNIVRLGRSFRFDLLFTALLGVWSNELIAPSLTKVHEVVKGANPLWAPTLFGALIVMLLSPLFRNYWPRRKMPDPQFYFLADDEIETKEDDILQIEGQAKEIRRNSVGEWNALMAYIWHRWAMGHRQDQLCQSGGAALEEVRSQFGNRLSF
jgi:hypothetical protein